MAQKLVSFRMNEDLKNAMETTCKSMGLSMSAAFTMFATKVCREQRIPFEITSDSFYNKTNTEFLETSVNQYKEGKLESHELIEA